MGILDTVKLPEGAKKRTSILDSVKLPSNRGAAFEMQSLQQRQITQEKQIEEQNNFHPINSFMEGWNSHEKEKTKWMPSDVAGETAKETWSAIKGATEDMSTRTGTAFRPAIEAYLNGESVSKADIAAGIGSLLIGGLNLGFSPIAGYMKGAETVPGIGHVFSLINKFAYGLAGAGAETFGETLEAMPIDETTKAKLRPLAEETGSLVGMIAGFKVAGKTAGAVSKSRFVAPKIERLEAKVKEMSDILNQDQKLIAESAKFVTEHGPVRNLPISSETPGGNVPVSTPKTKHAAYAKSQGYEPITPDSQLPVISIGDKAPSKELPVIEFGETGVKTSEKTQQETFSYESADVPKVTKGKFEPSENLYRSIIANEVAKEALMNNPLRGLSKYASTRGDYKGELREVTGKGKSTWERKGDDLITDEMRSLGLETTEQVRAAYEDYRKQAKRVEEQTKEINELLKQEREAFKNKEVDAENARLEQMAEQKSSLPKSEDTSAAEAEYAKMQGEAPAQESLGAGKPELMQPVEGTGDTRTSRLSARAEALQKEFETLVDGQPLYNKAEGTYQGMKMADIAKRVDSMSTEQLREMVRNPESVPTDIPASFIWKMLSLRNKMLKDPMITAELFRSEVSGFITRAAQEMRALVGIDKDSPESIITELIKERKDIFQKNTKGDAAKVKEEVSNQIREAIMKEEISIKDVEAFIKDITCK